MNFNQLTAGSHRRIPARQQLAYGPGQREDQLSRKFDLESDAFLSGQVTDPTTRTKVC